MGFYRLTRKVRAPKSPAGELYEGVIEESVARELLGEDFDLAEKDGALEPVIDPLPFKGWPTEKHGEKSPDKAQPIVAAAKFMVRCACGYAADSACEQEADAIASVASAHDRSHTRWKATRY